MATARRVTIKIGEHMFGGLLNDTPTAAQLWDQLPVCGNGLLWGDEIYFDIHHRLADTEPKAEVKVGDIAFWGPGTSLCLFWGPTPASVDERPRAASPVTLIGRIEGDPSLLANIQDIRSICVSRSDKASSEDPRHA